MTNIGKILILIIAISQLLIMFPLTNQIVVATETTSGSTLILFPNVNGSIIQMTGITAPGINWECARYVDADWNIGFNAATHSNCTDLYEIDNTTQSTGNITNVMITVKTSFGFFADPGNDSFAMQILLNGTAQKSTYWFGPIAGQNI